MKRSNWLFLLAALLTANLGFAQQNYFPIGEFGAWPACDFGTWSRGADTCNINTIYLVGYEPDTLQNKLGILKSIGQKAMLGNSYTGASLHNLERFSGGVYAKYEGNTRYYGRERRPGRVGSGV